jgi:predicted AlkP superfamily phosphohydrolase/phosphomutase
LAGNPYEDSIYEYYVYVDGQIGELLEMMPDDASVLVLSDHGAKAMRGGICINDWLIEEGYLKLAYPPEGVVSLELCEVEWDKTLAWGAGGYYGRLYLNIQGREPEGVIPANRVEAVKKEIAAGLRAIPAPDGQALNTKVFLPEQIYREVHNIPPDLLIYFDDLAWRSIGSVGNRALHTFENDTGPDGANHAQMGMYVLHRPGPALGLSLDRTWRAVCPTMLELLGLDTPPEMGQERLW